MPQIVGYVRICQPSLSDNFFFKSDNTEHLELSKSKKMFSNLKY